MRGIADVEQQSVSAARAATSANRGIQRDVVALARPGLRTGLRLWIFTHQLGNDRGKIPTQLRTVCCRRCTGAATRLHDRSELLGDERIGSNLLLAKDHGRVCTPRLCRRDFLLVLGDIRGSFTVTRGSSESLEDARRGYDRGLLGMCKRHLDDFDPEER